MTNWIKEMKMNYILIISTLILFFLFVQLVVANLEIKIDVNPSFNKGDLIYFNYTLLSNEDQFISYLPIIDCPNGIKDMLIPKTLNLNKNIPYSDSHKFIIVDDYFEPQKCKAKIIISEPYSLTEEKEFNLNISPNLDINLVLCKDELCQDESKIFLKNEDIQINYDSELTELIVIATLTFPDNTQQQITLPTTIKAEQIGTYELDVTASKEGYKTITKKEQFGVIEKEANIPYTKPKSVKNFNLLYILIFSIILIIIGIILYLIKRRKSESFA